MALVAFIYTALMPVDAAESQQPLPSIDLSEDRVVPYEVTVNGANTGTWILLERAGELFASADAIDQWRILLEPTVETIEFRGEMYFPISNIPGFDAKINFANQSLELLFSPKSFAATRLTRQLVRRPVLSPVLPSLFFNYDLSYTAINPADTAFTSDLSALTEVGISTGLGILTSTGVVRNLSNDTELEAMRLFTPLETTFTRDLPQHGHTLRLGDAYTKTGTLGRSIYFGGIQYGSNFSLTPGFLTQPLPTVSGLSSTPSTVELYVNDVLRQVSEIPTGPFAIENFPTLTGGGDARIVVRDLLGRETVIEQSFFTTPELLATGLNDWSVEAGRVRQDLGISSSIYGDKFISGFWRRGINNSLTFGGRTELTDNLSNVQIEAMVALPFYTLGRMAISNSDQQFLGKGQQWLLGFDVQRLRSNLSIEIQRATENYRQLGQSLITKPVKSQTAGNWSVFSNTWGSFGLGYARVVQYNNPGVTTLSANYSKPFGRQASLNITASRADSEEISINTISFSFIMQFNPSRSGSVYASQRRAQTDLYASMTHNPGEEGSLGWRALAGKQQNNSRIEGGAFYGGRYGDVSGDLSASELQTATRLSVNGGVVLTDSNLFVTRRVGRSFALAEIEGYDNIGIRLGGNIQTRTNAKGVALIPNLMPYQNNYIRLDPRELPISAEIDSIEQVAVPAYRSAVKVMFPVRTGRGALITVELDDGDVAPAGAIVQIEGDDQEFYVARRGQAFVTGLQPQNKLKLNWKNQVCIFDVTLPPESADEITRIGALKCSGVIR